MYILVKDEAPAEGTMFKSPIFKTFDFLLSIPIFHDILFGIYRKQVVTKAEKMGLDWTGFLDHLHKIKPKLDAIVTKLEDRNLVIPKYFYAPIHAYKDGNLCWESAMEEDLWSKLMIAPLYNNALDGDVQMRQAWLTITNRVFSRLNVQPKYATDLGCGTGEFSFVLSFQFSIVCFI